MKIIKKFILGNVDVNTYLVEHNNIHMLIDCGKANNELFTFLEENEIELSYILITHCHFDHIEGVDTVIEKYPNCKLVIPVEEKECLLDPEYNLSNYFTNKVVINTKPIFYEDLKIEGLEFRKITGHSKSSVIIISNDNKIIFSGDTVFFNSVGRSDLYYGDHRSLINGIKREMFSFDDEFIIYPGHGKKTSVGNEKINQIYKG